MECGPKNCPMGVTLSPAERKATRKQRAEEFYKQGFTMEQIGMMLGVTHKTISLDLKGVCTDGTNSQPTEPRTSIRGRKGEGRPKGSKRRAERPHKSDAAIQKVAAEKFLDEGKSRDQVKAETGLGHHEIQLAVERERGRREADLTITPDMLSMTAQQKLDAAIRQHKHRLDIEYEERVRTGALQAMEEMLLHYREKYARAERILKSRKGIMDRATYRKILSCLHPDRLHAMGIKDPAMIRRYEDAFGRFTELEDLLMDEKQNPTNFPAMPRTAAEWMEARRTKRGNGSHELRTR